MDKSSVIKKIESLPEELQIEVEDFIDFLLSKKNGKKNGSQNKEELIVNSLKGAFSFVSADFDEPLEEFQEYM